MMQCDVSGDMAITRQISDSISTMLVSVDKTMHRTAKQYMHQC